MKYVTLAPLLATVSSLQTIDVDEVDDVSTKLGSNVYWRNGFGCPGSMDPDSVIEYIIDSTESNLSFDNYKKACAEAFQSQQSTTDLTPCLQVTYMPGGADYAQDPDKPYYSCNSYDAKSLVKFTDSEWSKGAEFGINPYDDNNQVAACINYRRDDIQGLYGCRLGLLHGGSQTLMLGLAYLTGIISLI